MAGSRKEPLGGKDGAYPVAGDAAGDETKEVSRPEATGERVRRISDAEMSAASEAESGSHEDVSPTITATWTKNAEQIRAEEANVPAVWNIGDVIMDLYEVKEVHTGGAMGLVHRVHHREWNIDLAVKSPRPEFLQTESQKDDFVKECQTWVDLGLHPHVASCYYVRTLRDIPRVFAEYIEGGSLKDWIGNSGNGKLYEGGQEAALRRILDIAIQFAWGLHYAHEQGLVHQDVKPSNVMMTPDGIAKITDFGLAKARAVAEDATAPGSQQSILVTYGGRTPAYCSPEQASGQRLSKKTDIWSWGVSVLEMFVGRLTWAAGPKAPKALESYLKAGPEIPSIPRMPNGLSELLRECFSGDPEGRPGDMAEVAARLQQIYRTPEPEGVDHEYPREEPRAAGLQADGLNNRALSLMDLGQVEQAKQAWQQALEADPRHLESTYNLGLAQWRCGKVDDDALQRRLVPREASGVRS